MPANSVSPLSRARGPEILMEPAEHEMTASFGSDAEAVQYRDQQAMLISQGRYFDALQMDIADIRLKFGSKYDVHIRQALGYAESLDPSDLRYPT